MYSKISNYLFYGFNNNKDDSIYNHIDNDKVLLILDYLYINKNIQDISLFGLEDMITFCGYYIHAGKGKSIDQFKKILIKLNELQIIKLSDLNIKPKQFYKCNFIIDLSDKFFILFVDEKDKILSFKSDDEDNVDPHKLLLYYCYLKSRMYNRPNDSDLNRDGGKAECCFPSYDTIQNNIGLNQGIIKKYNDILISLNLIRVGNAGLYYYSADTKKKPYESPNTYVLFKDGWEHELNEAIKQFKKLSEDKVFINTRDYKNNDKHDNGFIARIQHLQKEGKAKQSDIDRMNELIELKNIDTDDEIKFKIKALLENPKYKNMLLSDIYHQQSNAKLFEKYSDIEDRLDIFANGEMLIDWDYYQWLMMNYSDVKHDYYCNCVKAKTKDKTNQLVDELLYGDDFEGPPVKQKTIKKAFGGFFENASSM